MDQHLIKHLISYPVWFILLAFSSLAWMGFEPTGWLVYLPFLISMVFLGLPHGAIDHLVPYRLRRRPLTIPSLIRFIVGYLLIGLLYGVAWWFFPILSAASFILLTWFHWGQGDLYTIRRFLGPTTPSDRLQNRLAILIRGGLPMLVPLIAYPDIYLGFMNEVVGQLTAEQISIDLAGIRHWLSWTQGLFLSVVLVYLSRGLWLSRRLPSSLRETVLDGIEILILWVYFSTVTPILAVGIYFSVWHSLRHICRLILIQDLQTAEKSRGMLLSRFANFFKASAPLTLVSLLFLALLTWSLSDGVTDLSELISIYLILIAMLTLPHTFVVVWMDRVEDLGNEVEGFV